jgi:hypothetical protein
MQTVGLVRRAEARDRERGRRERKEGKEDKEVGTVGGVNR